MENSELVGEDGKTHGTGFFACHSIEVFITATLEPAYSIKVNGLAG